MIKRNMAVFSVEYEMNDRDGKLITFRANVLAGNNRDDAVLFIRRFIGKPINVLSIGKLAEIDGVSDAIIEYLQEKLKITKPEKKEAPKPEAAKVDIPTPIEPEAKRGPGRPYKIRG